MANQKMIFENPTTFNYYDRNIYVSAIGADNDDYYYTLELYAKKNSTSYLVDKVFDYARHVGATRLEKKDWQVDFTSITPFLRHNEYSFYFKAITYSYPDKVEIGYDLIDIEITGHIFQDGYWIAPIAYDINAKTIALTGDANVFIRYASTGIYRSNPIYIDDVTKKDLTNNIYNNIVVNEERLAPNNSPANSYGNVSFIKYGVDFEIAQFYNFHNAGWNVSTTRPTTTMRKNSFANEIIDYTKLTCNLIVNPIMDDGSTTLTIYGNIFPGDFGKVVNSLKSLTYYYTTESGSKSSTFNVDVSYIDISESFYRVTAVVSNLNITRAYNFVATAQDEIMTVSSTAMAANITQGNLVFDWDSNNFNFNIPVNITNGSLEVYQGDLNLHRGDVTLSNGNLTVNGKFTLNTTINQSIPTYGTWTPRVNFDYTFQDETYSDEWQFSGNYTRIGDLCLINFYFKCIPMNYNSMLAMPLKITGLPFDPDPNIPIQAGGGMLSGFFVEGEENTQTFCGWTIEKGPEYAGYSDFAIFGRTAEIISSSTSGIPKEANYISGLFNEHSEEIEGSGTIFYKIAEGQ